jgi:hypothetical protein
LLAAPLDERVGAAPLLRAHVRAAVPPVVEAAEVVAVAGLSSISCLSK